MNQSTSSAAAFHAKIYQSPAPETATSGLKEIAPVSGTNTCDSLAKSGRRSPSLKTSPHFALADWKTCSGASMRSGTMRNGIVFRQPTLALPTKGTESGFLPTPRASEWKGCGPKGSKSHDHWLSHFYLTAVVTDSGKLNPTFAEVLMGLPLDWTDV